MANYRTSDQKLRGVTNTVHYEVNMIADRISPSGTMTDAFGRLRVAQPFTMFDAQNRYRLNPEFDTKTTGGGSLGYAVAESAALMTVGTAAGDSVIRETRRVMPYQPGKSLLILSTYVFAPAAPGVVQRVGPFGSQNGIFLELDGTQLNIVKRSYSSGSLVETRVPQSAWSNDKFDGSGYSSQSLVKDDSSNHVNGIDITRANIFWVDVEWLGVGDIRCGFVVDGRMLPAHTFQHENKVTGAYMTTACLPIRYEITNTLATSESRTMKQICTSVMSEGGFQPYGLISGISRGFTQASAVDLGTAGTEVPLISIRLKANNRDGVVIPQSIHLLTLSNADCSWRLWRGGALTGGTWANRGDYDNVEYNINPTAFDITSARILQGGFAVGGQQIRPGGTDNYSYQLTRGIGEHGVDPGDIITLTAIGHSNNVKVMSKMDWLQVV